MPPPLRLLRCLPHTSWIGFFAAFSSNALPCFGEIVYLFYTYDAKTYIDQKTTVPSFWFRWWRPGFLIAGILYDVGMLSFSIFKEDLSAILLAVRIAVGFYQLSDQVWMIKHWVPFFVQKEKRKFLFLRVYLIGCIWFLVVGSTSWTGSWQERNDIFASVYYISIFLICLGGCLWYLIQGGVDFFVKYRFHCGRNIFCSYALYGMILGIVGLINGDGGGNNLVETSNYHSAFVLIYFVFECTIVVIIHFFLVVFEELSWKYPNPIILPSTLSCNETTTFEATNGMLSASNKVACDLDVPPSPIEGVRTGNTVVVVAPLVNHAEGAINDMGSLNDDERMVEEDGKVEGDLEAVYGLAPQSASASVGDAPPSAISPSVTAPVLDRAVSNDVPYQIAHQRLALAFDGITRSSSELSNSILTHQIMMVKLKRHELVCREMDKIFCIMYQIFVWEVVVWLAQIFVTLYLQSVNTPTLPGHDGYYCQTPLENTFNSAQFVNDFVFARRR